MKFQLKTAPRYFLSQEALNYFFPKNNLPLFPQLPLARDSKKDCPEDNDKEQEVFNLIRVSK